MAVSEEFLLQKRDKMNRLLVTGICLSALLAGCGGEEIPLAEESSLSVDTMQVNCVIGEIMGDSNYVFGEIASALPTAGGGVAVLDVYGCDISFFDSSGTFIRSIGAKGEGPGEFLLPLDFAILEDGRIAVVDLVNRRIDILSEEGELLNSLETSGAMLPFKMSAVADSSFMIYYYSTRPAGDSFDMGFNLEIWNTSGLQEEIWSWRSEYTGSDFAFSPGYISYCSGYGSICYAEMSNNEFFIDCLNLLEGTSHSISADAVALDTDSTDAGYIEPKVYVNYSIDDSVIDLESEPLHYRPQVAAMGFDSDGRLWVRRGTTNEEDWLIFNSEGEFTGNGTFTGIYEDSRLEYVINKHGTVAWAPFTDDCPRVNVMSAN